MLCPYVRCIPSVMLAWALYSTREKFVRAKTKRILSYVLVIPESVPPNNFPDCAAVFLSERGEATLGTWVPSCLRRWGCRVRARLNEMCGSCTGRMCNQPNTKSMERDCSTRALESRIPHLCYEAKLKV